MRHADAGAACLARQRLTARIRPESDARHVSTIITITSCIYSQPQFHRRSATLETGRCLLLPQFFRAAQPDRSGPSSPWSPSPGVARRRIQPPTSMVSSWARRIPEPPPPCPTPPSGRACQRGPDVDGCARSCAWRQSVRRPFRSDGIRNCGRATGLRVERLAQCAARAPRAWRRAVGQVPRNPAARPRAGAGWARRNTTITASFSTRFPTRAKRKFLGWRGERRLEVLNQRAWHALANDKLAFSAAMAGARHTAAAHRRDLPRAAAILRGSAVLRRRRGARGFPALERRMAVVRKAGAGRLRQGNGAAGRLRRAAATGWCSRTSASPGRRLRRASAQSRAAGVPVPGGAAPHPALAPICGKRLSSVRVMTLYPDSGARIHRVIWKIPVGTNITDNYQHGAAGNLIAAVDPETGVSKHAVLGIGLDRRVVERHPDTGAALRGVALPQWEALKDVVLRGTRVAAGIALCSIGTSRSRATGRRRWRSISTPAAAPTSARCRTAGGCWTSTSRASFAKVGRELFRSPASPGRPAPLARARMPMRRGWRTLTDCGICGVFSRRTVVEIR